MGGSSLLKLFHLCHNFHSTQDWKFPKFGRTDRSKNQVPPMIPCMLYLLSYGPSSHDFSYEMYSEDGKQPAENAERGAQLGAESGIEVLELANGELIW
jgi:hypothetical protein